MPHVTIEYSANLDEQVQMSTLCKIAKAAMMETGLFELGAVRVRAVRCEAYAIADELQENAFVAALVRIGAGRSDADKKRLGESLFSALTAALKEPFASPHFALSLDIIENDPALSWKKNTIHTRLRK
jgi:5-carboxymethyl-2-hydroxymuconate isomerase